MTFLLLKSKTILWWNVLFSQLLSFELFLDYLVCYFLDFWTIWVDFEQAAISVINTKKGNYNQATQVNFGVITTVGSAYGLRKPLGRDEFLAQADRFNVAVTDYGASTDWAEELLRTSLKTQYNMSVSGGNENSNYL